MKDLENIQMTVPLAIKKRGRQKIISHLRRAGMEIFYFVFNHDWLFWLIGWANKWTGIIESVFLVYPATPKYARHYFYEHMIVRHAWRPGPSGLLWQNGKLIVMFAISASNGQFRDPANRDHLRQVVWRMEKIRQLFRAQRKTFAGILPGIIFQNKISAEAPEADLTAVAVAQAIRLVKEEEKLDPGTPIVVLGGKGFIGRRVVNILGQQNVFSVDLQDSWPELTGRILVVNITTNQALKKHLPRLKNAVVVNEIYPEPDEDTLAGLRANHSLCYHVVGVKAKAWPKFPAAYRGGIPCCAAWPTKKIKIIIKKMDINN